MDPRSKRRLTYVTTAIIGAMIVILAVILLQQPIPASTVPNKPGNPGGGNNTNNPPPTTATPPSVATKAATGIEQTMATLHGNLTSLGTASSVTVGFQYAMSSTFAGMTNVTAGAKTAPGALTNAVTGLVSNTTYYFRAWAAGKGYVTGSALTFTTLAPPTPPPGGNGTGNGHHIPPGWAHAACPHIPEQAPGHGVRARCEHNETWGQMKKEGKGDVAEPPVVPVPSVRHGAAFRVADPGNSSNHRATRSRAW
jgi:hypothetical protein